jgi:hypothetical protein
MRNTADVTGGKPIAVLLQSISGVSAINPLVAFYDIHGGIKKFHLRFIPEGVAQVSQTFLRDTHVELALKNTADVTGGKPIAVLLQSISGVSAINPLVAFHDIHGGKREVYSFSLSRTPHETTKWSQ